MICLNLVKNEISHPVTITMNRRTLLQASLASTLSIPAFALEKGNPLEKHRHPTLHLEKSNQGRR